MGVLLQDFGLCRGEGLDRGHGGAVGVEDTGGKWWDPSLMDVKTERVR